MTLPQQIRNCTILGEHFGNPMQDTTLFLQEAGLEDYAAAFNLAVDLLRVVGQADASYFGSAFDDH